MDKPSALAVALCAALVFAVPCASMAADAPSATPRQQALYRGSRIVGSNVRDPSDRKIGQIKDLILDGRRGQIAYAVVSFGGVMGVGNRLHAIPWQALEPDDQGRFYILHADRETIDQAPGFDKARWPDMTDRKWRDDIDRYWSRRVGRIDSGSKDVSAGSPVANPLGVSEDKGSGGSGR